MAMEHWGPFGASMERWEPFRNLSDIQGEVNRLFDSFFVRPTAGTGHAAQQWSPFVDTEPELAVQGDKVKATDRDGVLEIRLPKAEELKPKEIKIDIL